MEILYEKNFSTILSKKSKTVANESSKKVNVNAKAARNDEESELSLFYSSNSRSLDFGDSHPINTGRLQQQTQPQQQLQSSICVTGKGSKLPAKLPKLATKFIKANTKRLKDLTGIDAQEASESLTNMNSQQTVPINDNQQRTTTNKQKKKSKKKAKKRASKPSNQQLTDEVTDAVNNLNLNEPDDSSPALYDSSSALLKNESLRWEYELADQSEEQIRIELYKMNRRKRYVEERNKFLRMNNIYNFKHKTDDEDDDAQEELDDDQDYQVSISKRLDKFFNTNPTSNSRSLSKHDKNRTITKNDDSAISSLSSNSIKPFD